MRYRDWLNLHVQLLWCHNLPVVMGRGVGENQLRTTQYTNSGAWLVREGWAQVEHDGQVHRAEPGQWLIVKPGPRIQSFSSDARLISIAFDARWPDGQHLFEEGLSIVMDGDEVPSLESRARLILNAMKQVNPDTWDARDQQVSLNTFLRLERLLLHWLDALAFALDSGGIRHSGSGEMDSRIQRAVGLLNARDVGDPMDAGQLAAEIGMSQNHMIRLFQRDLQVTPGQYWNRLRVEYARQRLLQPGSRVKQVAIELGFSYLSHFSKWFKRHVGKTPRAFGSSSRVNRA